MIHLQGNDDMRIIFTENGTTYRGMIGYEHAGNTYVGIWDNSSSSTPTLVSQGGKIGIGTTTPDEKFTVRLGNDEIVEYQSAAQTLFQFWKEASTEEARMNIKHGGATKIHLRGNGNSYFNGGNVGIGTTCPEFVLDVEAAHPTTAVARIFKNGGNIVDAMLTIEHAGTGDPNLKFLLTGGEDWVMGIDNSDGDKFKISTSATLGYNDRFTIDIYGNTVFGGDVDVFGDVTLTGTLEKDNGSFLINHPLPSMTDTHKLRHSFIEGPRADLIYRGVVDLSSGTATVNIDTAVGMTEGTFEVLCRTDEAQVWLQNDTGWDAVRGSVSGNILTIICQNTNSTETISWMVVADRIDPGILKSKMYGEDGRLIIEPEK
jgi:hypothetical protein